MNELHWLAATCLTTALLWPVYVVNRMAVIGVVGAMANPRPSDGPFPEWAMRAQAAHRNAVENLVVFAPLVLAAHALGIAPGLVTSAAAAYFVARLAHFVVYTAGVPVLRTLAFAAGFAAEVAVALAILGLVG